MRTLSNLSSSEGSLGRVDTPEIRHESQANLVDLPSISRAWPRPFFICARNKTTDPSSPPRPLSEVHTTVLATMVLQALPPKRCVHYLSAESEGIQASKLAPLLAPASVRSRTLPLVTPRGLPPLSILAARAVTTSPLISSPGNNSLPANAPYHPEHHRPNNACETLCTH